jgi:16S rRNA (adenine1518-N6/adenine1519-N6)-dimethyltransferase
MKFLGQHFLKNNAVILKIIAALDIKSGETIVEIGPGHGELTLPLAEACKKIGANIIAIEKDRKLAEALRLVTSGSASEVKVIDGDVLETLSRYATQGFKLVGNIPYYITGHLLRTVGELETKPERCVLMIQKEVAERISFTPPKMNRLAASVQFWAEPELITRVDKNDFSPPPEVDSVVIMLTTKHPQPKGAERYYAAVRTIFAQPRKTILNNLAVNYPKEKILEFLKSASLDPESRPQNLTVGQIQKIADGHLL